MIVVTVYASQPGSLETGVCDPRDYGPEYVVAMRDAFQKHLGSDHRFVCLSDIPGNLEFRKHNILSFNLLHDWGGWWSKIELFRDLRFGEPVLYCDLDNLILGDISSLVKAARGEQFVMAWDWDYPVLNSSLMYWAGDFSWIYEQFKHNPKANAENFREMPLLGDQGYIASALATRGVVPAVWQRLLPGFFRSRWDGEGGWLDGAGMVLWHGKPKPWQLAR